MSKKCPLCGNEYESEKEETDEEPGRIYIIGNDGLAHYTATKPEVRVAFLSAGWLPPCEGRKRWIGKIYYDAEGDRFFVYLPSDFEHKDWDQEVCLILDPPPKEGEK